LLFSPELQNDTISIWISEIKRNGEQLVLEISLRSNIDLKGLQFQLDHIPFTQADTLFELYSPVISHVGGEKLFKDFSLYPKRIFSDEELSSINDSGELLLDYSNDVYSFIDFDSLSLFINNKDYIFLDDFSNLIVYIDTINSNIHKDGAWIYLSNPQSESDEILIEKFVEFSADSIQIPIGYILRKYQSDNSSFYNGLRIGLDNSLYNYSKLSIYDPRIDIMYTK